MKAAFHTTKPVSAGQWGYMVRYAWLPSAKAFTSWSGRLARRAFLVGWFGCNAIGGFLRYLINLGSGSDMFQQTLQLSDVIILCAGLVPLSALVAQRAHDIGAEARPLLLGMLICLLAVAILVGVPTPTTMNASPVVIGVVAGFGFNIMLLYLIVQPGQVHENRFGAPPP